MAATTTQAMGSLPSGLGICTTAPDIFYLPELVSRLHQSSDIEGQISRTILIFHDDLIQFCWYMRGGKCPVGHQFHAETSWRRSVKGKCSSRRLMAHSPSLGVAPSPLKFHSYCISKTHLRKNVANSTPRKGSRHHQ